MPSGWSTGIPRRRAPPNRTVGKRRIAGFLREICDADLGIILADKVIGADRIAFSVDCGLSDGRHVFEHVAAHVRDGQVVRQVDVETWDGWPRRPG